MSAVAVTDVFLAMIHGLFMALRQKESGVEKVPVEGGGSDVNWVRSGCDVHLKEESG